MSLRKTLFTFLVVCCAALAGVAQNSWTPEMQIRTKALGNPTVSPDGSLVAYTVTNEVMTADKSEYVTQIWLASADGKPTFASRSRKATNSTTPSRPRVS